MSQKHFDVVIAGGGVIGYAIAYKLSRDKNLSVAVIDKKKPGNATRASAGGLWPVAEAVGTGCEVIIFRAYCDRMAKDPNSTGTPEWPHRAPDFFIDFNLRSTAMYPALAEEMKQEYGLDFKLMKTGLKFLAFDDYDRRFADHLIESNPRLRSYMRWLDADELRDPTGYGAFRPARSAGSLWAWNFPASATCGIPLGVELSGLREVRDPFGLGTFPLVRRAGSHWVWRHGA